MNHGKHGLGRETAPQELATGWKRLEQAKYLRKSYGYQRWHFLRTSATLEFLAAGTVLENTRDDKRCNGDTFTKKGEGQGATWIVSPLSSEASEVEGLV